MAQKWHSVNLNEHWRAFLLRNPDARIVVDGVMERTGFTKDGVLFFLMRAWAEQNLLLEQQRELRERVGPSLSGN
jgi:hypothetical protein